MSCPDRFLTRRFLEWIVVSCDECCMVEGLLPCDVERPQFVDPFGGVRESRLSSRFFFCTASRIVGPYLHHWCQ